MRNCVSSAVSFARACVIAADCVSACERGLVSEALGCPGMSLGRGRAFYIHRKGIIFTGSLKKIRERARAHRQINNAVALNSYPRSPAGAHK